MKTKTFKIIALIFCSIFIMSFFRDDVNRRKPIYLDTAYSFKERAADLVSRMTLEEKQSQLGNTMPPIPRLGVNKYDVWGEALHGVMGRNNNSGKTATSFPNSVAVGSTWDPDLGKITTRKSMLSRVLTCNNSTNDLTTSTSTTAITDVTLLATQFTDVINGTTAFPLVTGKTYWVRVGVLATGSGFNSLSRYNYSKVFQITMP